MWFLREGRDALLLTFCQALFWAGMLVGIFRADFNIFCLGNVVLGAYQAAAQYYRLAAVDKVEPERRGRAVSLVLSGAILAALVAPSLALWTKDLFAPILFAGSFLALSALSVA